MVAKALVYLDANQVYDILLESWLMKAFEHTYETRAVARARHLYNIALPKDEVGEIEKIRELVKESGARRFRVLTSRFAFLEAYGNYFRYGVAWNYSIRGILPFPYIMQWIVPERRFREIMRRNLKAASRGEHLAEIFTDSLDPRFDQRMREKGVELVADESLSLNRKPPLTKAVTLLQLGLKLPDIAHLLIAENNRITHFATRDADVLDLKPEIERLFHFSLERAPGGLLTLLRTLSRGRRD